MHGIAGVLTPCVANGLEAARDADLLVRNFDRIRRRQTGGAHRQATATLPNN